MSASELWDKYKANPTSELRKQIILQYSNLIHYVINKTKLKDSDVFDYQDYFQFGVEGLYQALEKFDHEVGIKFETYAFMRIRGKIIDEIRKANSKKRLNTKEPNSKPGIISLDKNLDNSNGNHSLADLLPSGEMSIDEKVINNEIKTILVKLIKNLPPKERLLITLYYYERLTYNEISKVMGLTISRISQIHSQIVKKLRKKFNLLLGNN